VLLSIKFEGAGTLACKQHLLMSSKRLRRMCSQAGHSPMQWIVVSGVFKVQNGQFGPSRFLVELSWSVVSLVIMRSQ